MGSATANVSSSLGGFLASLVNCTRLASSAAVLLGGPVQVDVPVAPSPGAVQGQAFIGLPTTTQLDPLTPLFIVLGLGAVCCLCCVLGLRRRKPKQGQQEPEEEDAVQAYYGNAGYAVKADNVGLELRKEALQGQSSQSSQGGQ